VTLLLFASGWLVAAAVIAVVLGKAIREADEESEREARYRRALDEVEQRRRERLRRAMGDES